MVLHHLLIPRLRNRRRVALDVVGSRSQHMHIHPTLHLVSSLPQDQASKKDRANHAHVGCLSLCYYNLCIVTPVQISADLQHNGDTEVRHPAARSRLNCTHNSR